MDAKRGKYLEKGFFPLFFLVALILTLFIIDVKGEPEGPDGVTVISNETRGTSAQLEINISGGRIAHVNITATQQNNRWKGIVGNVSGSLTLDDGQGATLYDWSLVTITGEVYATRNSTTINWAIVNCSNATSLKREDIRLNHTGLNDNITFTFNSSADATHSEFFVGNIKISANTCPTLNTYVDNTTQQSSFEEIALVETYGDGHNGSIIFATILESDVTGYNGASWDFQMIVPENGLATFSGSTSYWLYVELT